jgi:hypothetical protein
MIDHPFYTGQSTLQGVTMDERPIVPQGDVLLEAVARLPRGTTVRRVAPERGRVVLARGELTGHLHSVPASAGELLEVSEAGRTRRYLRLVIPTRLDHQEHAPIELGAGLYRVRLQSEYAPLPGSRPRRRTVAD